MARCLSVKRDNPLNNSSVISKQCVLLRTVNKKNDCYLPACQSFHIKELHLDMKIGACN